MKEVIINGVEYLPASALTKQFRYTTDYIGQLCRAKKVDAQLIGRSWYVNPISLAEHKKNRHAKPAAKSIVEKVVANANKDITPIGITNNKPSKKVLVSTDKNFAKRISWKPLKYETDEQELLPSLNKSQVAKKITINLADSTDIAIKEATKSTHMVAEPLPTVSLSGGLKVFSAEDDFEKFDSDDVSVDLAEMPLPPIPVSSPAPTHVQPSLKHFPSKRQPLYLNKNQPKFNQESKPTPNPKPKIKTAPAEKVVPVELKIPSAKNTPAREDYDLVQKVLLFLIVLTLIGIVLLFCTDSVFEAGPDSSHWGIIFSLPSFDTFLY